jgi:hypothetical protein
VGGGKGRSFPGDRGGKGIVLDLRRGGAVHESRGKTAQAAQTNRAAQSLVRPLLRITDAGMEEHDKAFGFRVKTGKAATAGGDTRKATAEKRRASGATQGRRRIVTGHDPVDSADCPTRPPLEQ